MWIQMIRFHTSEAPKTWKKKKGLRSSSRRNVSPRVTSGDVLCATSSTMKAFQNASSAKPRTQSTHSCSLVCWTRTSIQILRQFCTLTFSVRAPRRGTQPISCNVCYLFMLSWVLGLYMRGPSSWGVHVLEILFLSVCAWLWLYASFVHSIHCLRRVYPSLPDSHSLSAPKVHYHVCLATFHCCDYYTYNYAAPPPPQICPYYPLPVVVLVHCLPVTPWMLSTSLLA